MTSCISRMSISCTRTNASSMSWRVWDVSPFMFRVATPTVSVSYGLRKDGSGDHGFQCFPLVNVGVLVLFRFLSCILSLFLSTCNFFSCYAGSNFIYWRMLSV